MLYSLIVMIFLNLFLINPLLLLSDEPCAIYSPPDMTKGSGGCFGSSIDSAGESSRKDRKVEKQSKWPYRKFEYVKAYLYNLGNQLYGHHALVKNNQLDKTVVGEGILLTQKQVDIIIETTNQDIAGLIRGLSKSYIPHHGFVFYNKAHQPEAYITLCFDCEAIRVYPEIKGPVKFEELSEEEIERLLKLLDRYRQIINETKLPIFANPFQYREYGKGLR